MEDHPLIEIIYSKPKKKISSKRVDYYKLNKVRGKKMHKILEGRKQKNKYPKAKINLKFQKNKLTEVL